MINQAWLDKIIKGLEKKFGDEVRKEIVKGFDSIRDASLPEEVGAWLEGFIEIIDNPKYRNVAADLFLRNCPCDMKYEYGDKIINIYNKSSNIQEFVYELEHQRVFGKSIILKNGVIYVTKPYICDCGIKHDHNGKYSTRCHCELASTVSKPVSKIFCYCGGGFYKAMFDELWQTDTRVEPISSVIAGDSVCVFAIYVPEKLLSEL